MSSNARTMPTAAFAVSRSAVLPEEFTRCKALTFGALARCRCYTAYFFLPSFGVNFMPLTSEIDRSQIFL
jgi:hypothetical protein